MTISLPRTVLFALLAGLVTFGSTPAARADFELGKVVPKVKFQASGKLDKTTAKIQLAAKITMAGKTKTISILDMGLKKKGKSVEVKRKIGKLKVSLKVSWSGARTVQIKGTARYLKLKIPMPTIKLRL